VEIDPRIIERFGNAEIGVIVDDDPLGKGLVRDLQRTRATVHHVWPFPNRLPTTFDLLFCEADPLLPQRIPWTIGKPSSALVLVMRPTQSVDIKLIENCAPHAAVHFPARIQEVMSSLIVAHNLFRYECRLRRRIDKLDENLRTMRSVERAKLILMGSRGLTEEEAYNYLRKQAMDRRASIGALATAIIDSQELLG
jgi:AmiR/NasT family two-component response regulator